MVDIEPRLGPEPGQHRAVEVPKIPENIPKEIDIDERVFEVEDDHSFHLKYRSERQIGVGFEGTVWSIETDIPEDNLLVPRRLAIKVASTRESLKRRLEVEVETLLKLQKVEKELRTHHVPRIVPPYGFKDEEPEIDDYLIKDRGTSAEYFIMEKIDYPLIYETVGQIGYGYLDYEALLDLAIQRVDLDLVCSEAGISQEDRKSIDFRMDPLTHHLVCLDWGVQISIERVIASREDKARMRGEKVTGIREKELAGFEQKAVDRFGYFLLDTIASESSIPDTFEPDKKPLIRRYDWLRRHLPFPLLLVVRDVIFNDPKAKGEDKITKNPKEVMVKLLKIYKELIDQARVYTSTNPAYIDRQLEAIKKMRKSGSIYEISNGVTRIPGLVKTYLVRELHAEPKDFTEVRNLKQDKEKLNAFRKWIAEKEMVLRLARRLKLDNYLQKEHGFARGTLFDQYDRIAERVGLGKNYLLSNKEEDK